MIGFTPCRDKQGILRHHCGSWQRFSSFSTEPKSVQVTERQGAGMDVSPGGREQTRYEERLGQGTLVCWAGVTRCPRRG